MKKKLNILLIVLLLLVYGGILRKLFYNEESSTLQNSVQTSIRDSAFLDSKTSQKPKPLVLKERDPFLDKILITRVTAKPKSQSTTPVAISSQKHIKKWPSIEYLGFLEKEGTGKKNALIRINGKLFRESVDEIVSGVEIKRITQDSVLLSIGSKKQRYYQRINKQNI